MAKSHPIPARTSARPRKPKKELVQAPTPPTSTGGNPGTRERLIEAAGEVFARRGYREATIREICIAAGANVAAVNYHFGDKDRLYLAVLQETHEASVTHFPPDMGVSEDDPPEVRLDAFVRSLLMRLLHEGRPAWHAQLMAREMSDPSPALEALVEQSVRPMWKRLTGICRELLGEKATKRAVDACAASVVGQCLHYKHASACMRLLAPGLSSEVASLASHITRYSLGGIEASRREGQGPC